MPSTSLAGGARRRGVALIAVAAALWGTVGVATQAAYLLADATPLAVAFYRLALALPVLIAAAAARGRDAFRIGRHDLGLMALIGAMLALYQLCFFAAIPRVGVAVATLVTLCGAPVIVALASAVLLRERPSGRLILALAGALGGVGLLVGRADGGAGADGMLLGVLLALGSACGYAVMALAGRFLAGRCDPVATMATAFGIGACLLAPVAWAAGGPAAYPALGWLLLAYLGIVPTACGYLLFAAGLRAATATEASVVTLLEPLVAAGLAWLLFGERLGPLGAVGAALLLGAILLLSTERRATDG